MITINFKSCCDQCCNRKTYLEENIMYQDKGAFDVKTAIGCEHEKVCKEYKEEVENK